MALVKRIFNGLYCSQVSWLAYHCIIMQASSSWCRWCLCWRRRRGYHCYILPFQWLLRWVRRIVFTATSRTCCTGKCISCRYGQNITVWIVYSCTGSYHCRTNAGQEVEKFHGQQQHYEAPAANNKALPAAFPSFLIALLPVMLIAVSVLAENIMPAGPLRTTFLFTGNSTIALLLSVLTAFIYFGILQKWKWKHRCNGWTVRSVILPLSFWSSRQVVCSNRYLLTAAPEYILHLSVKREYASTGICLGYYSIIEGDDRLSHSSRYYSSRSGGPVTLQIIMCRRTDGACSWLRQCIRFPY